MSNFSTFAIITEANTSTAPSTFVASTPDSLGTITAANYVDDLGKEGKIKANDLIYVNYSDTSVFPLNTGLSATLGIFEVAYSASHWSLVQQVPPTELTASVAVSATDFKALYSAPKLLLSAPGANKLIIVDNMQLVMTFGSADYAAGGVVAAQYDSTVHGAGVAATNTEAAADFFAAASTTFRFTRATTVAPFTTTVNKGLYLSAATQDFTTGDSTFVALVQYHVIAVA